ncbi:MAG: PucR family transcriptional regulator [Nocardioides sp.]|nr:PucR family transcriptional regulator [Nocardioides sp.]
MLDLCHDRSLALRAVNVPAPQAQLRWVATSELPDPGPFLEGGELVLTTGLATKGWRREWDGYVRRLVQAQVAALGFGTGLTHQRVPTALVRACERHGLNLIEVPRETPFVAVSRSAAELLQRRDQAEGRAALDMQRQLTAAAVRPEARSSLVGRLAELLDGAACLLTFDGRVAEPPSGPRQHLLDLAAVRDEVARLRPQGRHAAATLGTLESSLVIVPIGLAGRPAHYLAAVVEGRLSESRRSAVTTAVALLALAAEQDRGRIASRRRLVQQALSLLAQGDVARARLLATAADVPRLPTLLQAVHASGPDEAIEDALGPLEEAGLLAAVVDGQLWLAASPADVALHTPGLGGLRVGVSGSVELADVAQAHRTAALALDQATPLAPVVHWELLVRSGPLALIDPQAAAAFSRSFLAELDDEQVQTLASFVGNHGSRLRMAIDLGVHRNTVRNRLGAIEAVLGHSLDDPATRASAWLALHVRLGS